MGTRCWTGSSRWQSKENGLNREPAPDLWRQHRCELMLMFDVLKAFIEGIAVQLDVVERGVRSDFDRVKTTKAERDRIQWGLPKFDTYLVWGFEMIYIRRKTMIMGKCSRRHRLIRKVKSEPGRKQESLPWRGKHVSIDYRETFEKVYT